MIVILVVVVVVIVVEVEVGVEVGNSRKDIKASTTGEEGRAAFAARAKKEEEYQALPAQSF